MSSYYTMQDTPSIGSIPPATRPIEEEDDITYVWRRNSGVFQNKMTEKGLLRGLRALGIEVEPKNVCCMFMSDLVTQSANEKYITEKGFRELVRRNMC